MKPLTLITALALSVTLSGCSTAAGGNGQFLSAITEIAKDPKCGHTDRVNVVLGPISTGSVFLERNCPAPATPTQ